MILSPTWHVSDSTAGILYHYSYNKEPVKNSIGNCLGPYSTAQGFSVWLSGLGAKGTGTTETCEDSRNAGWNHADWQTLQYSRSLIRNQDVWIPNRELDQVICKYFGLC